MHLQGLSPSRARHSAAPSLMWTLTQEALMRPAFQKVPHEHSKQKQMRERNSPRPVSRRLLRLRGRANPTNYKATVGCWGRVKSPQTAEPRSGTQHGRCPLTRKLKLAGASNSSRRARSHWTQVEGITGSLFAQPGVGSSCNTPGTTTPHGRSQGFLSSH